MSALQVIWFVLIGVLLTGYAILDGFDLGTGFWYLFTKKDEERRTLLSAIGPFWDGNEVWLLTGAGAIFAAFPHVYATVFSGMYLALMLVIFSLIFRAIAIEFRNKVDSARWRNFWDVSFAVGSIIPAILFGVATGNILGGMRLDSVMNYAGGFFDLLNPYALLTGLLSLAIFSMHGASYLSWKTKGEVSENAKKWAFKGGIASAALFVLFFFATIIAKPHMMQNYYDHLYLWVFPLAALVALFYNFYSNLSGDKQMMFAASSLSIITIMATMAVMLFPNTVVALGNPELNLTIMNASSSSMTLMVMLIIAALGMPLVIGYHVWAYKIWNLRS
jgi:cytochrome d ubiquinol oxidase subunit II